MPQTRKNLKLFYILNLLTKNEIEELEWFLLQPSIKIKQSLLALFNEIKFLHPKLESNDITYRELYKKVFPEKHFNAQTIKNLMTEMLFHVKNYLIFAQLNKDNYSRMKLLLESINERKLEKLFISEAARFEKLIDNERYKSRKYYLKKIEAVELKNTFYIGRSPVGKSKNVYDNIFDISRGITCFYLIVMFEEYLQTLIGERVVKIENREVFRKEYIQTLLKISEGYRDEPMVELYRSFIIHHYRSDDKIRYDYAKSLLQEYENEISLASLKILYNKLLNHCVSKLKEERFKDECFDIVKKMLEKNLFFENNGTLSPHNYSTITSLGLRLNQIKWTENFIYKYKIVLPIEYQQNTFLYNQASLYFRLAQNSSKPLKKKYFEKTLETLSKFKGTDFYEKTRINNLLLLVHCELENIETALSLTDSYRHYLRKNRKYMPEHLFKSYANFVNYTEKFLLISGGTSNTTAEEFSRKIKDASIFEYQGWLLKKTVELERKG